MKSGFIGFINYELGYEWAFNEIVSEVNSNNFKDQKGFINLFFKINPVFRIESSLEFYKLGNTSQKSTQFWDIKINYIYKKYNTNIYLQGNVIFPKNWSI